MKTIFLDTEVLPQYFCCVIQYNNQVKVLRSQSAVKKFWDWLSHGDTAIVVAHNGLQYDFPLLYAIANGFLNSQERIYKASQNLIKAKKTEKLEYPFVTVDTCKVIDNNKTENPISLKRIESNLGMDIKECPVPFDLQRELTAEEKISVEEYCKHDVTALIRLYDILPTKVDTELVYNELVQMGKSPLLLNGSRGSWTAELIYDTDLPPTPRLKSVDAIFDVKWIRETKWTSIFSHKSNYIFDERWQLKSEVQEHIIGDCKVKLGLGGLHGENINSRIFSGNIINIDAKSYYTQLLLRLATGTIHDKYRQMADDRFEAQSRGDTQRADMLKLKMNAGMGAMFTLSPMYNPKLYYSILLNGQCILCDLTERFANAGISIIQVNTDGIFIQTKDYASAMGILAGWTKDYDNLSVTIKELKSLLQADVNNYVAITDLEKPVIKGSLFKLTGNHKRDESLAVKKIAINTVLGTEFEVNPEDYFVTVKPREGQGVITKDGNPVGISVGRFYASTSPTPHGYAISAVSKSTEAARIKAPLLGNCIGMNAQLHLGKVVAPPADLDYGWYDRKAEELVEKLNTTKQVKKTPKKVTSTKIKTNEDIKTVEQAEKAVLSNPANANLESVQLNLTPVKIKKLIEQSPVLSSEELPPCFYTTSRAITIKQQEVDATFLHFDFEKFITEVKDGGMVIAEHRGRAMYNWKVGNKIYETSKDRDESIHCFIEQVFVSRKDSAVQYLTNMGFEVYEKEFAIPSKPLILKLPRVNDVIHEMEVWITNLDGVRDMKSHKANPEALYLESAKDDIIGFQDCDIVNGVKMPISHKHFTTTRMGIPYYCFDDDEEHKQFSAFAFDYLKSLACGDEELATLLAEVIGCCISHAHNHTPTYRLPTLFFLIGTSGRNGKSTFLQLLEYILGNDIDGVNTSVAHIMPQVLHDEKNIYQLLNKRFNFVGDCTSINIPTQALATLKSICVGNDVVQGRRLYSDPTEARVRIVQLYGSNAIPTFVNDAALRSRYIAIPFNAYFDDNIEWSTLQKKLFHPKTLCALAHLGIDAFEKVLKRDAYTMCDVVRAAMDEVDAVNDTFLEILSVAKLDRDEVNGMELGDVFEHLKQYTTGIAWIDKLLTSHRRLSDMVNRSSKFKVVEGGYKKRFIRKRVDEDRPEDDNDNSEVLSSDDR